MKPVLAFCGAAGAGKDSAAKHLENQGIVRYGFARPLKTLCSVLFGWDQDQLDELAYKEQASLHRTTIVWDQSYLDAVIDNQFPNAGNPEFRETTREHLRNIFTAIEPSWTRRRILQWVGTEGFRALNPNHWTERAFEGVRELLAAPPVEGVAFTDLRFLNEASELRRVFPGSGFVLRVERADGPQGTESSAHISEQEWAQVEPDFVLKAKWGELDDLRQQAEQALVVIQERCA